MDIGFDMATAIHIRDPCPLGFEKHPSSYVYIVAGQECLQRLNGQGIPLRLEDGRVPGEYRGLGLDLSDNSWEVP